VVEIRRPLVRSLVTEAAGNPFADLTPDSNESTPSFADSGQTAAAGGAPAGRFGDSPAIDPAEATEPVPFGQTVAFDSGDPAESVAVVEPISAEESELIGATEPVPFGQPVDMGSELSDSASPVSSHAEERKPLEVPIVPEESGAEVGLLLKEIERRVAGIESRMDELTEGRERVERQVAAQTEELRVQRAAIARTQRAVRNMSRPDDAQATEPAPRDPRTS
jgi:hypothetical protein